MTALKIKKLNKGFTLIELLVVIGILAILLAITLVAINPAKQIGQANDTKRKADVGAILNAISQYQASNAGALPGNLTATCTSAAPCWISNVVAVTPKVNICSGATGLVPGTIAALPGDPTIGVLTPVTDCTTLYDTKYQVYLTGGTDNRVTVQTTTTYSGTAITATR